MAIVQGRRIYAATRHPLRYTNIDDFHPERRRTGSKLVRECPKWDGLPLTLDVSATFPEGAAVRDYYSQQIAIVKNGQITLQPAATSNGLLLLERAETDASAPFDWHNATVYFVLTDRFENGDPSNDQSYGRHKDGMAEIGTFHGGDLRGLTNKLDYLQQLGVNALWISAPFEQIHGWVGGGTKGDFPHYAYHGYYTRTGRTLMPIWAAKPIYGRWLIARISAVFVFSLMS